MRALVKDQGTAACETALCEFCFQDEVNQFYAREKAAQTDDVDPNSEFVDCTGNETLVCCICGLKDP